MALTYEPIYSSVVSSSQPYFEFSSIPSTYTDLVLIADCSYAAGGGDLNIRVNGDNTANYSYQRYEQAAANRVNNTTFVNTTDATQQALIIINFLNYTNTNVNKVIIGRSGNVYQNVGFFAGTWRSNSVISSIQLYAELSGQRWANGSRFSLYGIKAA